jgi:hypothetical protein
LLRTGRSWRYLSSAQTRLSLARAAAYEVGSGGEAAEVLVEPYETDEMKPCERRSERSDMCWVVGARGTQRWRAIEAFEIREQSSCGNIVFWTGGGGGFAGDEPARVRKRTGKGRAGSNSSTRAYLSRA